MTDPSVIEASNAWYAANVSNTPAQQASTAEQAAAINAAYRNNTLPVLPQYGDPVGTYGYNQRADFSGMSQEQRAVAYGQEGSPLILTYVGGDANTRGSPVYLTPQEYQTKFGISEVQAEQNKHIAAFSQPRNDLALSPAAQAIVNQYNATRYNTVTGGGRVQGSNPGSVYQENPYNPDSALGIAWDVARTGGGTDLRLNQIATGEAISMGVDPGFIRYATDLYYNRPALAQQNFTSPITGQQFQNNYWAGGPIRANLTISEIAAGGGVTPDNYLNASIYNASTRTMNPLASLATPVIGFESGIHVAPGDWGAPGSGNPIGGKTVAGTFGGDQTITLFVPISRQNSTANI